MVGDPEDAVVVGWFLVAHLDAIVVKRDHPGGGILQPHGAPVEHQDLVAGL